MQSAVAILSRVTPFATLSTRAVERLARACDEAEVDAGSPIYEGADPYLYVVGAGAVRLTPIGGDTSASTRIVGPLALFGGHDLAGAPPGPERADTARAASLLRIRGASVQEILASEEGDAKAVTEALVHALRGGDAHPLTERTETVDPSPEATSGSAPASEPGRAHVLSGALEWLQSPRSYLMLLGYALFFAAWYLAVEVLALPRFAKLPGITQVVREWLSPDPVFGLSVYTPVYYEHIWASLRRIAIAFFLATTLGVPVGLLLGWSRTFREYVFPVFELLRPIPILAWVPLAIIVFSGSETPVIFLTFLASFFATALNTRLGVKSIDSQYVLAAGCLGASRWQTFWHVIVPGSLPFVFTGLQISIGVAWFSLAAAEMVSGQFGLGYLINTSYTMVQYPTIIIGMLTLGMAGYATSAAVRFAGHRFMIWRVRELSMGRT
jgi:NitT/TauT family transport system permease protein